MAVGEGRGVRRARVGVIGFGIFVLAADGSCESSAFDSFAGDFARASCHRAFECCTAADRPDVAKGADEASCAAMAESTLRKNAAELEGIVRFDAAAAHKCIADLQQACSAVFSAKFGRIVPCQNVFVGAVPLGGACDADFVCTTNDCEGQRCVVRTGGCAVSCGPDQFCGGSIPACQPRPGAGQPCPSFACAVGLTCVGGTCVTPLADGQACSVPTDCAGTCSTTTISPPAGTCRPGLCQGL